MTATSGRLRMSRKSTFSSGHRYWLPNLDESENRRLFGSWASPFNHGHNYTLYTTVEGTIDEQQGMICNIKLIDESVKRHVVSAYDQKSLNNEVGEFRDRPPTLENLLAAIRRALQSPGTMPAVAPLVGLRLEEMPTLYAETTADNNWKMNLTRVYHFSAGHRLHNPALSDEENLALYGKCFNPAGHGHNYVLEVTVEGEPDPKSGMIVNLEELDRIVSDEVVDRYDHMNLNVDVPELQGKIPTCEIVALTIFGILKEKLPVKLARIRLQETPKNIFEVAA